MKAFLVAVVALVAITAISNVVLTSMEFSSAEVYSTDNVRLGE